MSTITFPKTSDHISDIHVSDANGADTSLAIRRDGSDPSKQLPAGVSFRLVNYEIHQDELQNVPMFRMEDLALVFYQEKEVMVSEADLLAWHCSPGQLLRDTMRAMKDQFPAKLVTLSAAIGLPQSGYSTGEEALCSDLYVLSNRQGKYGAAVIFYPGLLRRIAKKWGSGFYLIPSSVHELILIPDQYMIPIDDMRSIISEINQQELTFDEILSDQVYHYNPAQDCVVIADHEMAAAENP